eukprot:scaffold310_cov168-Amphora_coffeaeformis.AAC.11
MTGGRAHREKKKKKDLPSQQQRDHILLIFLEVSPTKTLLPSNRSTPSFEKTEAFYCNKVRLAFCLLGAKLEPDLETLSPTRDREQKRKIGDAITASRLQFDRLGLYGRDKEMRVLKGLVSGLTETSSSSSSSTTVELVLISGESGTGKSVLAESLRKPVEAAGGLFCVGKCSSADQGEPLSSITSKLGEALQVIAVIVPEVISLHSGEQATISEVEGFQGESLQEGQLESAVRLFLKSISMSVSLLVVLFDNPQFADKTSIGVIKSVFRETKDSTFLLIGCYRSNEVKDDSDLVKALEEMKSSEHDALHITELKLDNLSKQRIVRMLAELLSKDTSQVEELAETCSSRTDGNPFFLREFLYMLVEKDLLKFQIGTPCLGRAFKSDLLLRAWKHIVQDEDEERFTVMLNLLLSNGFLVTAATSLGSKKRSGNFALDFTDVLRFTHDIIQESVMTTCPLADLSSLQFRIGKFLLSKLSRIELDDLIFVVSSLVNKGKESDTSIATLNLQASRKAYDLACPLCIS